MSNATVPTAPAPGGLAAERLREIRKRGTAMHAEEPGPWHIGSDGGLYDATGFSILEEPSEAAMEFIAHAPKDVHDLLGEVYRLAAALDAATAALREIVDGAPEYLIVDDNWETMGGAYRAGRAEQHFACAEIARRALGLTAARPTDAEARA